MKLDQATKEKIAQRLQEKGAVKPCSRCGNQRFSLLDGFVNFPMTQELSNNVIIGGPSVPCAVVACDNCGHMEFHALGAIGLLTEQNKGG
jgi:predicted nucleic-acid-binding Zn-ribbon protein